MSLLPHTLLSNTSNEDQTLEIHSEILEPLAHSQLISRWEIPHKNVLDSDSQLIWRAYWDKQTGGTAAHNLDDSMQCLPYNETGLYSLINRARLYVNGVIISELNEVGKFLSIKKHFQPHEVKVEKFDLFAQSDNNISVVKSASGNNDNGQVQPEVVKTRRTPGDRTIGKEGSYNEIEASIRLGDLFGILEGAQLDTNSILGKIMIEIDWNCKGVAENAMYVGSGLVAGTTDRGLVVKDPRLILDFLTFNSEVTGALKNTIFGDGPGVSMPFKEVALVRKGINSSSSNVENSEDIFIGMTGRAVQKIWVAKVNEAGNLNANTCNNLKGPNRSDLYIGQRWNCKINDLMIFDRDVQNRAEEYNYLEQGGERQFTCLPGSFERREAAILDGYTTVNNVITQQVAASRLCGVDNMPQGDDWGTYGTARQVTGAAVNMDGVADKLMGRNNYLCVPCGKYGGGDSPANAIRVGSTPIIFNLQYNATKSGANDAACTAVPGTAFFFVEYLKMMTLKGGEISVVDL